MSQQFQWIIIKFMDRLDTHTLSDAPPAFWVDYE